MPKEKQPEEGIKICVETIQRLREIPGVKGIHIMAIEWEENYAPNKRLCNSVCMSRRPSAISIT